MKIVSSLRALAVGGVVLAASALSAPAQESAPAGRPRAEWTLDAVLEAAAHQHPLVEAARARVDAARGVRRGAGALPNPVATYQVESKAFPGGQTPAGLDRETFTYLTLPLEPLYQRWPRVRRADEEVRAAEAVLTSTRRQAALGAARAFYRLALAQVSVATAEETRAGIERLATFNRSRVAEGAAAEGDLIRVQVELDRAATNVALEEVELARARAELLPYLGGADAVPVPFDSLRVSQPSVVVAVSALPSPLLLVNRARQRRPELIEARARVTAAGAEAAYQRALTVRQVGATFGSKRTNGISSMIAGVTLPLPLFDQNRGEVQRASGERVAAEQELAWSERTITAQVRAAYESAARLSVQAGTLRESFLGRAEESRRITVAAYEEGAASLLQVLDATRTLGDARLTYYRVLFAQRQSLLDLAVAAGDEPASTLSIPSTSLNTTPTAGSTRTGGHP